jgi:hypothetical protein
MWALDCVAGGSRWAHQACLAGVATMRGAGLHCTAKCTTPHCSLLRFSVDTAQLTCSPALACCCSCGAPDCTLNGAVWHLPHNFHITSNDGTLAADGLAFCHGARLVCTAQVWLLIHAHHCVVSKQDVCGRRSHRRHRSRGVSWVAVLPVTFRACSSIVLNRQSSFQYSLWWAAWATPFGFDVSLPSSLQRRCMQPCLNSICPCVCCRWHENGSGVLHWSGCCGTALRFFFASCVAAASATAAARVTDVLCPTLQLH